MTLWGGKYFFDNKFSIISSFLGLLYVLGYFKQTIFFYFFLTKSPYLFAISVGQLYTRAAVKELGFRAEAGAVSSLRAESERSDSF